MWNGNHFGPTWPEVARFQRRSPSGTPPTRRVAEVAVQRNGNPAGQCGASAFVNGLSRHMLLRCIALAPSAIPRSH